MTLRRFSSPKKLRGLIGYLFPYSSILNKKEQAWLALSSFQKRARKHGKYFRRPIERQIEGFAGNRSVTLFAAILPARPATLIYVRRLSSARRSINFISRWRLVAIASCVSNRCSSSVPSVPSLVLLLFWRQRFHDFLKARIAAERIPEGMQF